MKSHSWDELNDSPKDFFDSGAFLPEAEFDEEPQDKHGQRRRLTELRRRTEERLDWKRMSGDLQFDDGEDKHFSGDSFSSDYLNNADDPVDD
jgi:hypothetical protein